MMRDPEKRGDPAAWKRITWDEAIDIVAEKIDAIQKDGDIGKLVYHKGRDRFGDFTGRWIDATGTEHSLNHTSICEASLKTGYETTFGQDLDTSDILNARYMMFWGDNIFEASYMHNPMAQRISEARVGQHRPKVVAVDPRLSQTAGAADEWIAPKPGTDAAIILAMVYTIMEEGLHDTAFLDKWTNYSSADLKKYLEGMTPEWAEDISGVDAAKIKRIAIEFAQNQPGFARAYNGISSHTNGTYNARCVALLNAVVGNIDKPGGFCLMKSTKFSKPEPVPSAAAVQEELGLKADFPLIDRMHEDYPLAHHKTSHLSMQYLKEMDFKAELYILHQYNPIYTNPDCQEQWDVMKDTSKIGFTVDFSPFLSETVQEVVDLVIPDCTYLERLMINTMPAVENFGYVHLYQPAIEPLYESHSMYDTLLEIAKKVPGMAKYFEFDTVEDFAKAAVEGIWGEGSWDRLKADGALINPGGGKTPNVEPADPAYKSYDELTPDELNDARVFNSHLVRLSDEDITELKAGGSYPEGDGTIKDEEGETAGVVVDGVAYKGFPTESGLWETFAAELEEYNFEPLPVYVPNPPLENLDDDDFVLITGKFNVHVQSRTSNVAWLMEIMHYNPLWMNRSDAKDAGIGNGDMIEMDSGAGVGKMECRVFVTEGIRPGTVFMSTSLGHWHYGPPATHAKDPFAELPNLDFTDSKAIEDNVDAEWFKEDQGGLTDIWWREADLPGDSRGETPDGRATVGWLANWITPNGDEYTDPIGGEFAWNDAVVKIKKVSSASEEVALGLGGAAIAMGVAAAAVKGINFKHESEAPDSNDEAIEVGETEVMAAEQPGGDA